MATITAVQNGNWNDSATWDLNRVPTVGDDVYIVNFEINGNITEYNIKSIHNTTGFVRFGQANNIFITSNIYSEQGNEVFRMSQHNRTVTINGNIYGCLIKTDAVMYQSNRTQTLNINGNVEILSGFLWCSPLGGNFHYNTWNITINGNVELSGNAILINTNTGNGNYGIYITVNGNTYLNELSTLGMFRLYRTANDKANCTFNGNLFVNNYLFENLTYTIYTVLNVYGIFEIVNDCGFYCCNLNNINIFGAVKYHNKNKLNSLFFCRGAITTTENFKCLYVGDGEPLVYCVPSVEFPNENDVRDGVPYADGQLIGKLQTVTVDNTNTINVYPYKRRCN